MKISLDKASDALYFFINDRKVEYSEEIKNGVVADFDEQNMIVGIEILGVSKIMNAPDLNQFIFETV